MARPVHFLTLILLWTAFPMGAALAQTVTGRLDIGKREARPDALEYVSADGGLVTLGNMSSKSSRYQGIIKYDANFKKEWSHQVLAQNGRANLDLLAVLGENIYVFISEYFPRDRTIRTGFSRFDLDGNQLDERQTIAELPNEKEHRVDMKYTRSINKKKLLCYRNLNNAGKRETILYYLFDAYSDEIITGEIEIPYPDDRFTTRKIVVSNDGNIYLLGKYYMVNRVKNPDDYGFKIYRYRPGEEGFEDVELDAGALYITDLTMKVDRDENIFLAGFYSHKSTDELIGTTFYRLSPNLETEVRSNQRFGDDFLNNFMRERQIDRGQELKNFFLDNIILRSDGGVLLIAEKYYTSYNSYMDVYGYWVDQRIHHYDEIIISSVAANGDLEWSGVAHKRQSAEVRDHLSYLDVVSGSSLYLIYGYEPRRAPRTIWYNEVDAEGNVAMRDVLLENEIQRDDLFYPRLSEQISNNEALLVYYQGREKIFSVIRVEF